MIVVTWVVEICVVKRDGEPYVVCETIFLKQVAKWVLTNINKACEMLKIWNIDSSIGSYS